MKVIEALDRAREQLDDESKNDWSDADLLVWYNDGVVLIRSSRADTLIDTDGTLIAYVAATAPATDDMLFAEAEKWVIALADYIPYRAFGEDAGDKRDAERSTQHWNNFGNYIAML